MKKFLTLLLTVALTFAVALSMFGCGANDKGSGTVTDSAAGSGNNTAGGGSSTETEYTITFDSLGGSAVAEIKSKAGAEISAPAAPVKDGFIFSGWFESTDGGVTLAETAFAFAYMPAKNLTLYAKWNKITEVGKTYKVKDYKTDVSFVFDDPSSAKEATDEEKLTYSTMYLKFGENNAVEIFLYAGMPVDGSRFYAVNAENCVEFYETASDAQNMTNKLTDDYYGFEYRFDSNKKTLTVSMYNPTSKVTVKMVLSVAD